MLCDTAQRELIYFAKCIKKAVLDFSQTENFSETADGFFKYTALPENYLSLLKIIENGRDITALPQIKIIGKTVYADKNYNGEITVFYNAAPTEIISFNSSFCFDDNDVLATIPYYVASVFMKEENSDLAKDFSNAFEAAKSRIKAATEQSFFEEITDVVGTGCR